jgi:PAS domain S-box-containing protein
MTMLSRKAVVFWRLVPLTIAYFVAGKFGLSLAFVNASASAVWPPTGIAFAAFLVLGHRVWPAVLIGAFLVNVTTAGSIATSLAIASGNTLEGLLGAYLVRRFANGRRVFERARDVFKFTVLAALVSTTVSATTGATAISMAGYARWPDYGSIWFTWWLGDAVGDLVVAPVLVLWSARRRVRLSRGHVMEAACLLAALAAIGIVVFGGILGEQLAFLCLLPLLWAAFRFGQRDTATLIALLSTLATWGTVRGRGPFADQPPSDSLLLLQAFLGTMAITSILIAAVVAERKRDEAVLAYLASIVESSDDAIVSKTLDGVITTWNSGAERLYGYTAAEAIGQPVAMLIPPDRPNELQRVLDRLRRGEHVEPYETLRVRKDGSLVQVSVTVSPLRNALGAIIGASAIGRDITEEKRAEAALREATALRSVASLAVAAAHEINNPLTVVSGEVQLLAREGSGSARWGERIEAMGEALERIREVVVRMSRITRLEPAEQIKHMPEMLDLKKSSADPDVRN